MDELEKTPMNSSDLHEQSDKLTINVYLFCSFLKCGVRDNANQT